MGMFLRVLRIVGLLALIVAFVFVLKEHAAAMTEQYMFFVFATTGTLFSLLLGGIFVAGVSIIIDRGLFYFLYGLCFARFSLDPKHSASVFAQFLATARQLRATSKEGVYSEDIIDHARQSALEVSLDGQEIDVGRTWLEFLGAIAPTLGFIGTLVGLMESFHRLGIGAEITEVLQGLALSMVTSLLGATISVLFLSAAWLLGLGRRRFDRRIQAIISGAQSSDSRRPVGGLAR